MGESKRTTAAELIASLAALPPDTPVFVDGYEGGLHDAGPLEPVEFAPNVNAEWYYGPHEDATHPTRRVGSVPQRASGVIVSRR